MSAAGVVGQSLHSGVFYVLNAASRLLLALALGKTLSSQEYGTYSLITTLVAMSPFLSFSAFQYYMREVPGRPAADGARLFKSIVGVQTLVMAAVVTLVFAAPSGRDALSGLLELPDGPRAAVAVGALLVFDALATDFNRYLYARKQIAAGNTVMFLQSTLWACVAFALFLWRPGALGLWSILAFWFAGLALAVGYGSWRAGPRELWAEPMDARLYLAAVRFGLPLLATYSLVLVHNLGRFLLAGYYSTDVVGVFAYHYNIIMMIGAISAPLISSPVEPYIVEAYNTGRPGRSGDLLTAVLRYRVMIVLPLLVAAAVWDERLVALMARPDYAVAGGLLVLLAPLPVLGVLAVTFERVLFLERRTGVIGRCYVCAAAVQFALYLLLMPVHPYYGPAVAMDLALVVLATLLRRAAGASEIGLRMPLGRIAFAAGPAALSVWGVAFWGGHVLRPLALLAVGGAVSCGVYFVAARLVHAITPQEGTMLRDALHRGWRVVRGSVARERILSP